MEQLNLFNFQDNNLWHFENLLFQKGYKFIAGIDEAGRGPLAGPVIAASVAASKEIYIKDIFDSKSLSSSKRKKLFNEIISHKALKIGIGHASALEIDELNILNASLLAFSRSLTNLNIKTDYCLIDGNKKSPYIEIPQQTIVKGDKLSFLIACASIIAKETRDEIMNKYDKIWPIYEFSKHKGYPTISHRNAIKNHGFCKIHRKTFRIR